MLRKPMAAWLYAQEGICYALNYATLAFELGFIFLLFTPLFNSYARILAALMLLSFHWGIGLFVDVGSFNIVATSAAVLILPSLFWNKLQVQVASTPNGNSVNTALPKWQIAIIGLCLLIMVQINLKSIINKSHFAQLFQTIKLDKVINGLSIPRVEGSSFLRQSWTMYHPNPPSELGWVVVAGFKDDTKENASNLYENNPLLESKPQNYYQGGMHYLAYRFKNYRQKDKSTFEELAKEWLKWEQQKLSPNHKFKYLNLGLFSFQLNQIKPGKQHTLEHVSIWQKETGINVQE